MCRLQKIGLQNRHDDLLLVPLILLNFPERLDETIVMIHIEPVHRKETSLFWKSHDDNR